MILELLLKPVFFLVGKGFEVLNFENYNLPFWLEDTLSLLSKGMMFFPVDVWVIVIANIVFWLTILFAWSIIEWIYRKIPGIN